MRKLNEDYRRKEQITALFTKDEKQKIVKAALAKGIAPSLLVRNAALNLCQPGQEVTAA
jgi:hypothetical protein